MITQAAAEGSPVKTSLDAGTISRLQTELTSYESDSWNMISQQPEQEENLSPAGANRGGS